VMLLRIWSIGVQYGDISPDRAQMIEFPQISNCAGAPLGFQVDTPEAVVGHATGVATRTNMLAYVVTANLDHVATLARSQTFVEAYKGAAARTLDGMPLVWVARRKGERTARRITGHDLLECVIKRSDACTRLFALCATKAIGERFQSVAQNRGLHPEQVGFVVPPIGFEHDPEQTARILEAIVQHGTTHLILGIGAPKSEIWCHMNASRLPGVLALCVGEAVSVFAGCASRAPAFMQRSGLEWLFRLLHEPRRLAWRYLVRSWTGLLVLTMK
jgi:N-acetylglucosaminyldiphosphoundecaprenol N-acetyl-beta-D-mannosaminyltransferase